METRAANETNQYLTFSLGEETYAMAITSVREIIDDKNITRIPRTPEEMRGIINLRGHALPVVDLRRKFGMSMTDFGVDTCIIIAEVDSSDGALELGALADSVQEVVELDSSQIDPPPRMGASIEVKFIKGMGKIGDEFIIILDVDRIFSSDELEGIAQSVGGGDEAMTH